ncbi:MAG: sigma-54 dependent transcriptional regulator, partial [Bacteroidales bacterium]
MNKKPAILIIDDNRSILQTLELLLRSSFSMITTLADPAGFDQAIRKQSYQVVLLDMNFKTGINNGNEGLYWLGRIKEANPALPVVLFTAYADISLAVEGMKRGAADFITKPWNNEKLLEMLLNAATGGIPADVAVESAEFSTMFWGDSEQMATLRKMVPRIAATDANVLITGENGTGKEMLAREIHRLSLRKTYPMVSVDMGTIPDSLFESELFGYVKGAFTDAKTDKPGKFEVAANGTLFMDEVGNMPLMQQSKLLSVLQTRTVVPVGAVEPVPVNIRLVTATNGNLPDMVKAGAFREDLFYRINTIHLELPSLRQRKVDIPDLSRMFIGKYAGKYNQSAPVLSDAAIRKLSAYAWPGN